MTPQTTGTTSSSFTNWITSNIPEAQLKTISYQDGGTWPSALSSDSHASEIYDQHSGDIFDTLNKAATSHGLNTLEYVGQLMSKNPNLNVTNTEQLKACYVRAAVLAYVQGGGNH